MKQDKVKYDFKAFGHAIKAARKSKGISRKLPSVAALQAEYGKLQEQREALYADYGKLKKGRGI